MALSHLLKKREDAHDSRFTLLLLYEKGSINE